MCCECLQLACDIMCDERKRNEVMREARRDAHVAPWHIAQDAAGLGDPNARPFTRSQAKAGALL